MSIHKHISLFEIAYYKLKNFHVKINQAYSLYYQIFHWRAQGNEKIWPPQNFCYRFHNGCFPDAGATKQKNCHLLFIGVFCCNYGLGYLFFYSVKFIKTPVESAYYFLSKAFHNKNLRKHLSYLYHESKSPRKRIPTITYTTSCIKKTNGIHPAEHANDIITDRA